MKKIFLILIIGFAVNSTYANNLKIGTVNVSVLLDKAPQVQQSNKEIADQFKPQEKEMLALAKEYKEKSNLYSQQKSIISAEKAREIEKEIIALQKKIKRTRDDIQEELEIKKNEELQRIQNLINDSIQEVGTREGYDLILYEGIAFNNDKANVTPLVLEYLENVYKK